MALLHPTLTTRLFSPSRSRRFSLIRTPPSSAVALASRPFIPFLASSHPHSQSRLPFPPEKTEYYKELEAAVDVVERACRLCVDVKKSLLSTVDNQSIEKNDSTPVTVADFGVQALISLELGRLFPSIPLVAEEDSTFLRTSPLDPALDAGGSSGDLLRSIVSAVAERVSDDRSESLTSDDILEAIDRGVKDDFSGGEKCATYWILDPIDGTRGFLRGKDALYVVGLALVVQGNTAIGVMGCPNWRHDYNDALSLELTENMGMIMVSHVGCGTWARNLSPTLNHLSKNQFDWRKCSVDGCSLVHEAFFCIPDSQTWESLPLSSTFGSSTDVEQKRDPTKVVLRPTCCGSLCKYMMVASARASVFILRAKTDIVVKVWDHAAGMLCVHEAGGWVTDWGGNQLDIAADQLKKRIIFPSGGVLVTNGTLHTQILQLIAADSKLV